jgi:hypothetical protein
VYLVFAQGGNRIQLDEEEGIYIAGKRIPPGIGYTWYLVYSESLRKQLVKPKGQSI